MKNLLALILVVIISSCARNAGDQHLHDATESHEVAAGDAHDHEHDAHDHGQDLQDHNHAHEHEEGEAPSDEEVHHEDDAPQPGTDITVVTLRKQPFSLVLKTGGRISVDSRDISFITAGTPGVVKMNNDYLFPGVKVSGGEVLFTLSGGQLSEDNPELALMQVKADLDRAKANFERAEKLISDKIITEDNYLSAKNEYDKLLNTYNNLNANTGRGGNLVRAAGPGFIREIFVTEGEKVTAGQQLASIVSEHNLVLQADVSPDQLAILPTITSANFTVGYSDKLYRLDEMNGKKISQGKSTGASSYYIPVFFRMDYQAELIDGTFAEVYLLGNEIPDAIAVPNTALMEEFGKIYVFVKHDDGDYIKRYVQAGSGNGESTMILSGLSEGETIVATGTYNVKLSQASTAAPGHAHNH